MPGNCMYSFKIARKCLGTSVSLLYFEELFVFDYPVKAIFMIQQIQQIHKKRSIFPHKQNSFESKILFPILDEG